jgi:hypothetical protein
MGKINCWEHKNCGRQPGGHKSQELGICPVTRHQDCRRPRGGMWQACWVAGLLCGKDPGTYAQ